MGWKDAPAVSKWETAPKAQAGQVRPGISSSKWTPTGLALDKVTMGLSSNAAPLLDTVVDKVRGDNRSFGDLFNAHQKDQDRTRAQYQAAHPRVDWATFPLNFVGGPRAIKGPQTFRKLAVTGAKLGAVSGAANSRGSVKERALQTGGSTLISAGLAPVTSKLVSATAPVVTALTRTVKRTPKLSPVNKIVKKTLEAQSMTPRQAGDMITAAQKRGVPLALMDTGDEMRGVAASLARKPGDSRSIIRDVVVPRQQAQAERIQGALTRDLGPTANIRQQSESLMQQAQAAAGPLYKKAYSNPGAGAIQPQISDLLTRPSMRRGLANAMRIAAEEGRDPSSLGFTLNAAGEPELTKVPSWQTLDYVKRGIDDVIEGYRDSTTGRLNLDTEGRAVNNTLRDFLGRVDKVNPDYAAARKAYAEPASMTSALNKGSKAATKDAETIWAETRDLNPAQLDQYRLGARTGLANMMDARVDNADKVRALIGTPKKRDALAGVFGGDGGLDNFLATLGDESAAAQTYQRAFTGSPTALNLADDANLDGLAGVAVNAGGRALGGQGLFRNGISTMADIARYGLGKKAEATRTSLANLLTETDPKVTASVLDEIIKQGMLSELINTGVSRKLQPAAGLGGYGGGQAFGRFLPYLEEQ